MWTPASLFLEFSCRCDSGVFIAVDDSAWQLPSPALRNEAIPPQHENPVLVVNYSRNCDTEQAHDVVFEALYAWRLYVNKLQLHPAVVIDGALAVNRPGEKFVFRCRHWLASCSRTK